MRERTDVARSQDSTATVPLLLITRDTVQSNAAGDSTLDVAVFAALLVTCASNR